MGAYRSVLQLQNLMQLSEDGLISNYKFKRHIKGGYTFNMSLSNQKINNENVNVDFTKYNIKIVYLNTNQPKIFIDNYQLTDNTPHIYNDHSLCLYHASEFEWNDTKSIAYDLIPWVYMWIYYYELWLEFDEWYGEEYEH